VYTSRKKKHVKDFSFPLINYDAQFNFTKHPSVDKLFLVRLEIDVASRCDITYFNFSPFYNKQADTIHYTHRHIIIIIIIGSQAVP